MDFVEKTLVIKGGATGICFGFAKGFGAERVHFYQ